jgi:AmmeMemoRadiSam system protein B
MNHYAPEAENRRKDRMALDAMLSGDPKKLVDTCQDNAISMCGLIPAAIVMQTLIQLGKPFKIEEIGYDTSGRQGNQERVVGYAGVVFRAT